MRSSAISSRAPGTATRRSGPNGGPRARPASGVRRRRMTFTARRRDGVSVSTVVPAKAGTHNHRLWNMGPQHKRVYARVFDALCAGTTVSSDGEAIAELRITRVPYPRPSPAGVTRGSIAFDHTRERAEGMDCRLEAIEPGNDGRGAPPSRPWPTWAVITCRSRV